MALGDIDRLIAYFSRLPGMGTRSAMRTVVHLLKRKDTILLSLLRSLENVYQSAKTCEICGNLDISSPCHICNDTTRDHSTICVIADVSDLWALERTGFFKGTYHVLGHKLSALDGITPEDLAINPLITRIKSNPEIREVLIAMSTDIDGQTTVFFVKDKLQGLPIKVTALSHGMPMGSDLGFLDDGTLIAAIKDRKEV